MLIDAVYPYTELIFVQWLFKKHLKREKMRAKYKLNAQLRAKQVDEEKARAQRSKRATKYLRSIGYGWLFDKDKGS